MAVPNRDHPGTPFCTSASSRGIGVLQPGVHHQSAVELPDDEFPLMLTHRARAPATGTPAR